MEKQGVRENPIRRSGYALQGGAGPQVERFQLASERAGEVQANRTNPRRKGATPTMGVSEVRGGYTGQKFLEKMMKKGGNHTKAHYEHDREGKLLHETMEAHEAEGRAMKGGRSVPSSGLSQFRGGAGIVGGGKACSDSDSDMEGGLVMRKSLLVSLRSVPSFVLVCPISILWRQRRWVIISGST